MQAHSMKINILFHFGYLFYVYLSDTKVKVIQNRNRIKRMSKPGEKCPMVLVSGDSHPELAQMIAE